MCIIPDGFLLLNEEENFPTNTKTKPIFQILTAKRELAIIKEHKKYYLEVKNKQNKKRANANFNFLLFFLT